MRSEWLAALIEFATMFYEVLEQKFDDSVDREIFRPNGRWSGAPQIERLHRQI